MGDERKIESEYIPQINDCGVPTNPGSGISLSFLARRSRAARRFDPVGSTSVEDDLNSSPNLDHLRTNTEKNDPPCREGI